MKQIKTEPQGDGSTFHVVEVPGRAKAAGHDEVAVVVRRQGGITGWWRRPDGTSPGGIAHEALLPIARVVWPEVTQADLLV